MIGMGHESDLLITDGMLDDDRYVQNLENLKFSEKLDDRGEPKGWIE
jgi:hypothetical protein